MTEHLKNPNEMLDLSYRALCQEGFLLLEFPTVDSFLFEVFKENFFWVMPPYHLFLFSIQGIQDLLARSGFEIIHEHRMPLNHYFVESVCRKIQLDSEEIVNNAKSAKKLFSEIDLAFDMLALKYNKSSSVQLICKKV